MSRLKGKPFEILNVSMDDDRAGPVQLVEAMSFPGIHTWDEKGPENPIAELYNVRWLPTTYLLDAKGVIRKRDPFGNELLVAIESIMKQSNTSAGK